MFSVAEDFLSHFDGGTWFSLALIGAGILALILLVDGLRWAGAEPRDLIMLVFSGFAPVIVGGLFLIYFAAMSGMVLARLHPVVGLLAFFGLLYALPVVLIRVLCSELRERISARNRRERRKAERRRVKLAPPPKIRVWDAELDSECEARPERPKRRKGRKSSSVLEPRTLPGRALSATTRKFGGWSS